MANEIVYEVKRSGKHGFILKVDFHVVLDSVIWVYLEEVKWISLIRKCISGKKI
jgi:hypothetical protein